MSATGDDERRRDREGRDDRDGAGPDRERGTGKTGGGGSGGDRDRPRRTGRPGGAPGRQGGYGQRREGGGYGQRREGGGYGQRREGGGYGQRREGGGYGQRREGGYGPRRDRPTWSGREQASGGVHRYVEPDLGDQEETRTGDEPRSLGRAATTGKNLWNPSPPGARRPDRAPSGGARRSTNTVGGEQVEGRQAVRELLAAGKRAVSEIWLIEGNDPSPILGEIDNLARKGHVPVRMVSPRRLESVQRTETPQGVVAFAAPLASHDLEELALARKEGEGDATGPAPFLVIVDGVTDPHNLGAILRSAECAGATGAVLPRHRAVHVTAAVTKAAAGAVEHLPIALVAGIPSALQDLERLGVRTVGLDEHGETSLFDLDFAGGPVALVLGAEGRGLSPLSRRRCDVVANIPLHGEIPSLNVSTAAAVACFEVARARSRRSG